MVPPRMRQRVASPRHHLQTESAERKGEVGGGRVVEDEMGIEVQSLRAH